MSVKRSIQRFAYEWFGLRLWPDDFPLLPDAASPSSSTEVVTQLQGVAEVKQAYAMDPSGCFSYELPGQFRLNFSTDDGRNWGGFSRGNLPPGIYVGTIVVQGDALITYTLTQIEESPQRPNVI